MKTPFKMKYNTSPLKSRLNSPLKQSILMPPPVLDIGQQSVLPTEESMSSNKPSYYTVPCDGGNCPTPKLDKDPDTPGHQLGDIENFKEVQKIHDEIDAAGSGGGGYMTPRNQKILSKVTFDNMYDLRNRINSNRTYTAQFKNTKGSQVSYADAYKKTGIWEGEGSLPSHLEGTHKKPNILQRIFHKSNFKWKSGGTT
jgi:hypothetical protein